MVVHTYQSSLQEAEAGGFHESEDSLGCQHSEFKTFVSKDVKEHLQE